MSVAEHRPSLVIGAYTEELPHVRGTATGILGAPYDPGSGIVGPVAVLTRTRNPSFAAVSATGRRVYVVNETASPGGITAFARDRETGALRELNSRPSGGAAPCHLAIHSGGRFLLVANYESGSVVAVALEPDGRLGREHARVQHGLVQQAGSGAAGSGADPLRQAGPHAHMVAGDPVTGDVLVADLGLDAVLTYRLTESGLAERPGTRIDTRPGTGPRHLAFHPDGRHLFVVGELDSTVLTLRRAGGRFVLAGVTSTRGPRAAGGTGPSLAAAIRVAASGRHVFVSNRGDDSIAMLRFDPGAALTLVHLEPAGGRGPRDFCLSPDGRHLVVANTGSDNVVVLRIDEDRPGLTQVGVTAAPSPSSVTFAP